MIETLRVPGTTIIHVVRYECNFTSQPRNTKFLVDTYTSNEAYYKGGTVTTGGV